MVNFDEFVVMQEEFLNKLNVAVDKIIREKKSMNLDYDYIEKALKLMVNNRNAKMSPVSIVVPIKKEEMIKTSLEFFESIDDELYQKVIDVVLADDKDIKLNIYNVHSINDFRKKDENNFLKYTTYGVVQNNYGCALVNIPMSSELTKKEADVINKNNPMLEDLYLMVHELSHLLDLNLDIGKATKKEIAGKQGIYEVNITRELTAEATAIAFEGLLSEYLIENKAYPRAAIQQISNRRINSCLQKARIVYTKLILAREKEEKGKISLDFIENNMRNYGLSVQGVRGIANDIINYPDDMLMQNRYAIGGLIAPTIVKTYKEKGAEPIKSYLEYAKQCNLKSALNQIGIQLDREGIERLNSNFKEYKQLYNLERNER